MFSAPSVIVPQFDLQPNMVVADLGCGIGAYTFEISKIMAGTGKIFALDVQKNLVDKVANECLQKQITHITALWDDLDDANGIGLQDMSIDRAVVANTLFQIDDKQKFALEVKRILKKGGQLLVVDWSESFGGLGPTPQSVVSRDRSLELFQKVGLAFVKDIQAGEHHYGFIMQSNI